MRHLLCALAAFGMIGCTPPAALAGDLGGYVEDERYVERPARMVERERIVERRYYEPRYYYEAPEVHYVPRPRVYRYYAAGYPDFYGPRFYYRHRHWRGDYGRW